MNLKRQYTHMKQRPESFYNPCSHALYSEVSGIHKDVHTLQDCFTICDTPVLMMLPDTQGKYVSRKMLMDMPGVEITKQLSRNGTISVVYMGKKIDMYPLATWFQVKPGNVLGEAVKTKQMLRTLLENAFQPVGTYSGTREKLHIPLLASPSQTGLMLLQHSLPYGQEYPTYDEFSTQLAWFNYQGRVETFYHGNNVITDLHYYDGRWMYASCLRHVPTGTLVHDYVNAYMPYVPGFYYVEATVPDTWEHIGLLPLPEKGSERYPNKPGEVFVSWASSHEISLAIQHSWKIRVLERFLWPETDKLPEPLKQWGEKLVKLRMETLAEYPQPYQEHLSAAIRNIMLQALGTFNRTARKLDAYVQDVENLPQDAQGELWLHSDEVWKYHTTGELSPYQTVFMQPHWIKAVWGLARKKLAQAALQVPYEHLIAMRIDGIWTNIAVPFEDTGKVGQFRLKPVGKTHGLTWPKTNNDMLKLLIEVRG